MSWEWKNKLFFRLGWKIFYFSSKLFFSSLHANRFFSKEIMTRRRIFSLRTITQIHKSKNQYITERSRVKLNIENGKLNASPTSEACRQHSWATNDWKSDTSATRNRSRSTCHPDGCEIGFEVNRMWRFVSKHVFWLWIYIPHSYTTIATICKWDSFAYILRRKETSRFPSSCQARFKKYETGPTRVELKIGSLWLVSSI